MICKRDLEGIWILKSLFDRRGNGGTTSRIGPDKTYYRSDIVT